MQRELVQIQLAKNVVLVLTATTTKSEFAAPTGAVHVFLTQNAPNFTQNQLDFAKKAFAKSVVEAVTVHSGAKLFARSQKTTAELASQTQNAATCSRMLLVFVKMGHVLSVGSLRTAFIEG